ncbi:endonuclease/exonuclease/phosphatase family protein [Spirulina sp. CS-785/01]|uniref:endonuclease/exonuclease/phosphatase family protein n=1 Tax=Spirulina sp. CS-785/01 TaxID=3021716 RepID=UPI00232AC7AF|nr:endonuclease/exonuclease/phosphatase family protein [Spirulina sp. CS-785/01]MDB9315356.1 endonuclease/exonuclease/phosphatase family protein [Spirulina sp. CS-785/01]
MLTVATINILFNLQEWEQRGPLLMQGLAAETPDIIGIQEVNLAARTDQWLAEQLGMPYVFFIPYQRTPETPSFVPEYGAAILSRHPFLRQDSLDLQSQGRFSQLVEIAVEGQSFIFCNGHYFWYPGPHEGRVQQVQLLCDWLLKSAGNQPMIAVGDFNGTPDTPAMALMRKRFNSAHATVHGKEPDYTCPTPLGRRGWKRWWKQVVLNLWANRTLVPWRGTLDYIYGSPDLEIEDCRVILNQPDSRDRSLYPSDHFGLVARFHP